MPINSNQTPINIPHRPQKSWTEQRRQILEDNLFKKLGKSRDRRDMKNLFEFLSGMGWIYARTIKLWVGISKYRTQALASMSGGHIISGAKGYRLNLEVSDEEANQSINKRHSQARKIVNRANEIAALRAELMINKPKIKKRSFLSWIFHN